MRAFRISAAVLLLLFAGQALACVGGQQWIKDTGEYTIDVTDDTPTIQPGQPVHFDYGLFTKELDEYGAAKPADFTDVQVALVQGTTTTMQTTIKAQADRELTGFDYTFPDVHADYVMHVNYRKGEAVIASIDIPLTAGGGGGYSAAYSIVGLLALTVAITGGIALARGKTLRRL